MSGQDCSYASQAPQPESISTSGTPSHDSSTSPGGRSSQGGSGTLPDATPLTAPSLSNPNSPKERPCFCGPKDPTHDEAINLSHVELVAHLTLDKGMFNLTDRVDHYPSAISFGLKTGLESPYLLHQLLAFSARHLAFLYPERSASYLRQADTLQSRAISLFNATAWHEDVNRSNCVPILLFSSTLAHHILADTLAKRDLDGLGGFMTHYVQCMEMQRGIYTIAKSAWPLLMESELEPVLSYSVGFTSQAPRGNHCKKIRELVDRTNRLNEKERGACRLAIQYLQVGFDAVLAEGEEQPGYRYQMLFSWAMLASPEFTALLAAKRPEALVLLGYYALLLHYGRAMWQVRDAGAYILGLVVDYLDPGWHHWLEYPREAVARDLG